MKKLLAIALCLAMLLGCTAALAEEKEVLGEINVNGSFTLKCALPEGYAVKDITSDGSGVLLANISSEDETRPYFILSVAFDELMAEVDRLNDLDENALAMIEDTFRIEDTVEITYTETAYGTKLMMVKEVSEGVEFVDFYTIYKGYGIEFVLITASPDGLTDADIDMAVKFLSDLDFVAAE